MFEEFKGNTGVSKALETEIEGCLRRGISFGHTLISGQAGMGKKKLANLMAEAMDLEAFEIDADMIRSHGNISVVKELVGEFDEAPKTVIVKNVERLGRSLQISLALYIQQESAVPFVLLCSNRIDLQPLLREICSRDYRLESYSVEELAEIIAYFKIKDRAMVKINVWGEQWYAVEFSEQILTAIAERSRGCPQVALELAKKYYGFLRAQTHTAIDAGIAADLSSLQEFFSENQILAQGFRRLDREYLEFLLDCDRPMSARAIALHLEIEQDYILNEIEPFLRQQRAIIIEDGRRELTPRGIAMTHTLIQEEA